MAKLDDDDAYRLLVVQKDFDELLDKFSEMRDAEAAVAALDTYVAAVQNWNAVLADYNTLAAEYIQSAGQRAQLQNDKDDLHNDMVKHAEPNLPAEMVFATALYKRTRERCVKLCYLASLSLPVLDTGAEQRTLRRSEAREPGPDRPRRAERGVRVRSMTKRRRRSRTPGPARKRCSPRTPPTGLGSTSC